MITENIQKIKGYFLPCLPGSAVSSGFAFGGRPILIFLIISSVFGGLE
jgi:hypothetical protein